MIRDDFRHFVGNVDTAKVAGPTVVGAWNAQPCIRALPSPRRVPMLFNLFPGRSHRPC